MILKIIGWIAGALFLLFIVSHLLGLVALLSWLVAAVIFVCGIVYLVSLTREESSEKHNRRSQLKLWDLCGQVYMFKSEPTVQDLVSIKELGQIKDVIGNGQVISIDNDTRVHVLQETAESLRVKIMEGQAKGKSGWVCRSSVIKAERTLPGS